MKKVDLTKFAWMQIEMHHGAIVISIQDLRMPVSPSEALQLELQLEVVAPCEIVGPLDASSFWIKVLLEDCEVSRTASYWINSSYYHRLRSSLNQTLSVGVDR